MLLAITKKELEIVEIKVAPTTFNRLVYFWVLLFNNVSFFYRNFFR